MEVESGDFDHEVLAYLSTRKLKLIESHQSYILDHPEMREILNDFLSSLLLNKPDDVYLFAKEYFHPFNTTPVKNKPLIICGPFGVGKQTLRKKVLTQYGDLFGYSVSYTTRKKKPEEDEGEYHFITREQFEKMEKEGKFFETAVSWDEKYGTAKYVVMVLYVLDLKSKKLKAKEKFHTLRLTSTVQTVSNPLQLISYFSTHLLLRSFVGELQTVLKILKSCSSVGWS
jgi:hypothetical protein